MNHSGAAVACQHVGVYFAGLPTVLGHRSWEEICADPVLRNLPYKIETNARGQIVMSPPARNEHSAFQLRIASLLECLLPQGNAFTEAATETEDGTKANDVAWTDTEHARAEIKHASWQRSPRTIVEVWSPHNTDAEMSERRALFFGAGAEEFWTCDLEGVMRFWTWKARRLVRASVRNFCVRSICGRTRIDEDGSLRSLPVRVGGGAFCRGDGRARSGDRARHCSPLRGGAIRAARCGDRAT